MRLEAIGERDGWQCWICGGPVDRTTPAGTPAAPSVDHVVPRSRGGATDPVNLRLAHRRCNGRRGSRLPELDWPDEFGVVDAVPLWQALARLTRRPGRAELVALLVDDERADAAGGWACERAERFLGGTWSSRTAATGATGPSAVWLTLESQSTDRDAGRPRVPDPRRRKRRSSRRVNR